MRRSRYNRPSFTFRLLDWIQDHVFIVFVLFAVLIVGGIGFLVSLNYQNGQTLTSCQVTDKDRTTTQDGMSDARIYTANCGTLSTTDLFFAGEFNSADTFAKIEPGKTYTFETTGYRFGLLSMFPVIREVTPSA